MSKILRRLVLVFALAALCLPAQAQRFVKVFDNIPALLAANPNDVNTNAFVAGLSTIADGGGGFYTWNAGSTATTNADLSILKANNYSTGRWYRFNGFIIAGGTNQFDTIYVTNLYVTNLTVTSTNTFITNFFFNNTYITNISQGDNWVAEGETNSTLPGVGKLWKLIATNSVEVGQPGDTPLIELTSPNAAYTNVMSLDSSGVFTMTNNGVLLLSLDPNGGVEAISQFANGYFAATSPFGSQGRLSANGALLLDSISGLGGSVSLSPGAPTNNTPFTLVDNNDLGHGSILVIGSGGGTTFTLYADGPILVENTGVTNFYISTPSGFTGTGTNYLSDNGTYHAVDTLTDGTDFIEVIGGKAYFSAGLDIGSDSSPFGPVDDIQMEGTLNVFGSGVGTANYEKFTIDHQGSSGVILDSVAGGSGTARDILVRIGGQGKVKITSGALVPASSADYNLGATTTANSFWNDVFSKGIYYTYGFGEGTADTESGAFYHNGSSALITESLSAGSGVARDFYWKSNGVTVDVLALNSGYTGAGTKFKSDDGTYKSANGTIWTNRSGSVELIATTNTTRLVTDANGTSVPFTIANTDSFGDATALDLEIQGTNTLQLLSASYVTLDNTLGHEWWLKTLNKSGSLDIQLLGYSEGDISIGFPSVVAAAATNGFLHIPSASGLPTGVPYFFTSTHAPIIFNRADNRLWAYNTNWFDVSGQVLTKTSDAAIGSSILVKFGTDADHVDVCGAANTPIGVALTSTSGASQSIRILLLCGSVSTMTASGTVTFGSLLEPGALGTAAILGGGVGTHHVVGRSLETKTNAVMKVQTFYFQKVI